MMQIRLGVEEETPSLATGSRQNHSDANSRARDRWSRQISFGAVVDDSSLVANIVSPQDRSIPSQSYWNHLYPPPPQAVIEEAVAIPAGYEHRYDQWSSRPGGYSKKHWWNLRTLAQSEWIQSTSLWL